MNGDKTAIFQYKYLITQWKNKPKPKDTVNKKILLLVTSDQWHEDEK